MNSSKQRGVTMIGWLVLLTPMAIVFYAGIRIVPIYLNYMRVAKSVDAVAKEAGDASATNARKLQIALEKRLDIESVDFPDLKDFVIKRDNAVWIIQAKYEDVAPLFANLSILLQFDKVAEIK
jgi:uncharacterized protein DUF4845